MLAGDLSNQVGHSTWGEGESELSESELFIPAGQRWVGGSEPGLTETLVREMSQTTPEDPKAGFTALYESLSATAKRRVANHRDL